MTVRLVDLASVIRSKNSGPFELTLDIIFKTREIYEAVKNSGVLTRQLVIDLYHLDPAEFGRIIAFDPASAIKITFRRKIPSGSLGDTDIYGAQQHAPLLDLTFDLSERVSHA